LTLSTYQAITYKIYNEYNPPFKRKGGLINYLNCWIKKSNKDQVDAYSKYAHALSVSSAIGAFSLFFSTEELLGASIKFTVLILVTAVLFIFGIHILRKKNDD
jgi:hypothetical protein